MSSHNLNFPFGNERPEHISQTVNFLVELCLIYSHEQIRSWMEVFEMSILQRVTGLSLRDRVRNSFIY